VLRKSFDKRLDLQERRKWKEILYVVLLLTYSANSVNLYWEMNNNPACRRQLLLMGGCDRQIFTLFLSCSLSTVSSIFPSPVSQPVLRSNTKHDKLLSFTPTATFPPPKIQRWWLFGNSLSPTSPVTVEIHVSSLLCLQGWAVDQQCCHRLGTC